MICQVHDNLTTDTFAYNLYTVHYKSALSFRVQSLSINNDNHLLPISPLIFATLIILSIIDLCNCLYYLLLLRQKMQHFHAVISRLLRRAAWISYKNPIGKRHFHMLRMSYIHINPIVFAVQMHAFVMQRIVFGAKYISTTDKIEFEEET